MTDVPDASTPDGRPHQPAPAFAGGELEVDLAAFLPEGTSLAEAPSPGSSVAPGDPQVTPDAPAEPLAPDAPNESVAGDESPNPSARPAVVDVAVLTRIEGDLAAVDDALLAIDAGEPHRSALLVELLAGAEGPASGSPDRGGATPT